MAHPVVKHRLAAAGGPPAMPAPSPSRRHLEPRLLPLLLPIIILGGLAMLHVVSLARLSMLQCESKRLGRLCQEQEMRNRELTDERDRLMSGPALDAYALKHRMTAPANPQPVRVGVLPPARIYWPLPSEKEGGALPAEARIGMYGGPPGQQETVQ